MPVESIGVAEEDGWAFPIACAFDQFLRDRVNRAHVLAVNLVRLHSEGWSAQQDIAGNGFRIVGVFVVEVVLANIDNRKLPERLPCSSLRRAIPARVLHRRKSRRQPVRSPVVWRRMLPLSRYRRCLPTIALAPRFPVAGSAMCIEPPLPLQ